MLTTAYAARGAEDASVSLRVVDDTEIARLNEAYLHHEGATDVLAFDDGEMDPDTGRMHLGDIAVSLDTAARVAAETGMRPEDEVTLYALHGLLHLLGMRDNTEAGRAAMKAAQREEFAKHGLRYVED